jgi:hypothetical protein
MKKKKLGVFFYNRLFDPVIQSNFWLYINNFFRQGDKCEYIIYLITYEDEKFPLTDTQRELVKYWELQGLVWKKLKWNPGIDMFSKFKDIIQGFFAVLRFRLRGCSHFVSLASIAGSYLYLYHLILRFKFFLYQFEPHSEYAIDNKMWPENGLQFRIVNFLEKQSAKSAKVISSGTRFMKQRLKEEWKVSAVFFKISSVANDAKFLFSQANRDAMRNKLGFGPQVKVIFYPGKFGGLYYREKTALMFKWLREENSDFHLLVVTPHTDEELVELFSQAGVIRSCYTIAHSDYADIHHYFSAADFAVIAVPPGPSKKFISNIKVGEYLTAGLPFLITEGISEDYLFALENNVGVVVKDFEKEYVKQAYPQIMAYLNKDREELRKHCREKGLEYRGFHNLNKVFHKAVSSLFS